MKAPDPGVYPGVSFDTYATWEAANHSILRHFAKTPAHAYWEMTHQEESTPFQALGHLIHMAVLEPHVFKGPTGPVIAPKVDRRTNVGKATWAAFEEENKGRQIVTTEDMRILNGIMHSIANHATAREALYGYGASELSAVWLDPGTGVLCKGRWDRLCEIGSFPTILDVKTIGRPAATHTFEKAVYDYGYHEQAALYLLGAEVLVPPDPGVLRKFVWLVCETDPPYCVRMFEADEVALEIGRDEIAKYLRAYKECKESKVWPAWPEGVDLAGVPAWVYKRFNLE